MIMFSPQQKNFMRTSQKAVMKALIDDLTADKNIIFDHIPIPTCLVDIEEQKIIKTNLAFQNFLITHKLTVAQIPLPLAKLKSKFSIIEEIRFTTFDHKEIVINLSTANLKQTNQPTAVIFFQDLTNLKKLEKANSELEQKLNQTLSTSQIGYWNANLDTGLTTICAKMAKDWGIEDWTKPVSSEKIMKIVHPDDRPIVWKAVEQAYQSNSPYHAEYRIVQPDGKIAWIEAYGEYVRNQQGHPYQFSGISINITEKVREKEKLIQDLEKQKALLSRMAKQQEYAEKANKNKTVFLANASHEIRTPLTAILGYADLLKDGAVSEQEKNQFVETINRNGNALIKIIDDVLDLSKVEANCLELENTEFSIQELLQNVIYQFKDKAKNKNIYLFLDFQSKMPSLVISDSVRLQQIMTNLLSNAIKFTDRGGVIVQAKAKNKKNNQATLEIKVIDTGIGLTEEQKQRLFQPFMQADSSTCRKFGGTGLGLALSKRLAEALGGELLIERCEKDGGCTFTLRLNVNIADSPKISTNVKSANASQMEFLPLNGFNILLAEDSEDNQFFIKKFLTKYGAKVTIANNGLEAIEKCNETKFDAILMDIEMPYMDGYKATQALRHAGYTNPIIALTAHAMADEKSKTREAGCSDHVTKPINIQHMLATLDVHLKNIRRLLK